MVLLECLSLWFVLRLYIADRRTPERNIMGLHVNFLVLVIDLICSSIPIVGVVLLFTFVLWMLERVKS